MMHTIQLRDYVGAVEARQEASAAAVRRARRREELAWRVIWLGAVATLVAGVVWGLVR